MVELKGNTLSVVKKKKISSRQMQMLKSLEAVDAELSKQYTHNILGLSKIKTETKKYYPTDRREDKLSQRPKQSILAKLLAECDTKINHVPNPQNIGEWIGVEIECFIKPMTEEVYDEDEDGNIVEASIEEVPEYQDAAKDRLRQAILESKIRRVHIKHDGSLQCPNGGIGVEITVLINSTYGYDQLYKLDKVLAALNCYVNATCGLHVHLDARHFVLPLEWI